MAEKPAKALVKTLAEAKLGKAKLKINKKPSKNVFLAPIIIKLFLNQPYYSIPKRKQKKKQEAIKIGSCAIFCYHLVMSVFRKIILILVLSGFLLLIISSFTFAQRPLEVDYPVIEGIRPQDTSFSLPEYVKYLFNFSLGIVGLVVFIALIYAGFRYLASAGNPATQKDARDGISAAVLGLTILLFSYLILVKINPEMIFLSIPERIVFDQESAIEQPATEKSLAYVEIPVGSLIGELFESGRLASLKSLAATTTKQSEKVETLTEELYFLTNQCTCANISPECPECAGTICPGDPCPVRDEINQKREELEVAISEKEEDGGLEYWRQKLSMEVEGYLKDDGEKFIGFREIYEDLKEAENMIKECPFSASKNGKTRTLLAYSDFWEYRGYLEDFHDVKKDEPEYPFDYIVLGRQYYLASFYCAEIFYQVSPIPISEEDLGGIEKDISSDLEANETICSQEISIGETVDNAEELARIMLIELDNINSNALKEIEHVKQLVVLADPGGCVKEICIPEFNCYIIYVPCGGDEGGEDGGDGADDGGDGGFY